MSMKVPRIIKLSEKEAEKRKEFFQDSTKDENGLINAIENYSKS